MILPSSSIIKLGILTIFGFIIITTLNKKEIHSPMLNPSDSILAFGDSITFGFNAPLQTSYPSVLSTLSGLKVINAGIPAETSEDGLKRLPSALSDPSIKLMILCFGGNDILNQLSMAKLKSNLKQMILLAKSKGINVVLVSVPNIGLLGLSPLELYEEVALEENIPLISGLLATVLSNPSLKSDQIHPNAKGYTQMGEKIYEKLRKDGFLGLKD